MELTTKQYEILLNLYHEFYYAFTTLKDDVKTAFFKRLYERNT